MVPGQQLQRQHLVGCCILVVLAALLLVATGVLLAHSVLGAVLPVATNPGFTGELVESLFSFLPPEWLAGLAALAAAGYLWTAFQAATEFLPDAQTGAVPPGMPMTLADRTVGPPDAPLPADLAQARHCAEQARILAESLTTSVTNTARVLAAGSQASIAAGQGAARLQQMQGGLRGTTAQIQQASSRLERLVTFSQQAEGLLTALQERMLQASLGEACRAEFKQVAILIKTMDRDASDSQLLLHQTLPEVSDAARQAQQGAQAVAEMGQAAATLAEEAGCLHQVAEAQADICSAHAAACAALAAGAIEAGPWPAAGPHGDPSAVPARQFAPSA